MSRVRAAAMLLAFAVAVALAFAAAQQREPGIGVTSVTSTVTWYTEEQAERGELSYARHCARCHGVELEGVLGSAPALTGPSFFNRWGEQPMEHLFHYTRALMPLDMPGALAPATYADILAYVLQENGFSAGADELRPNRYSMGRIQLPGEPPESGAGPGDEGQP